MAEAASTAPINAAAAEAEALRNLLHEEIENKTRACAHQPFLCPETRIVGYRYCLQHILQDKQAPYTSCAYTLPISGQRCPQAAPIQKNKHFSNYCFEHSRLCQKEKTRMQPGKMQRPDSVEAHLGNLTHYVRMTGTKEDTEVDVEGMSLDPLVDIDAAKVNERSRKILDYASDSSDDEEDVPVNDNTWPTEDMDNSDCESVDSDVEDPLKHAGIYTTEEACRIAREKLIRLRTLYLNQFHRLGYLLREKRRKYLLALRKEREQYCSIANQPRDTAEERLKYEQLKALTKYHKHSGVEAVLRRKYIERRIKAHAPNSAANKPAFTNKCTFADGSVKCPERAIPCSKFCRRHIMQDRKQVLFRVCGVEKGGITCQDPVPMIFDDSTCNLHIEMPPERSYLMRKYESDPEEEDDDEANDSEEEAATTTSATLAAKGQEC